MLYSMKEVCRIRNLSYDSLKYYCNEWLVPNVKRNKNMEEKRKEKNYKDV